ncbi:MAG: hypothetical protein Q9159_001788 [Coniocarpon cinnabarinum]
MEHIWLDVDHQWEPEHVPVIGKVNYDDGEFDTFPERMGYTQDSLLRGLRREPFDATALSVIQEWLFFGLLQEVLTALGYPYQRSEFEKRIEGSTQIFATTSKLPAIMGAVSEICLKPLYANKDSDLNTVANQFRTDGREDNGREWLSMLPFEKQLIILEAIGYPSHWREERAQISRRLVSSNIFFQSYHRKRQQEDFDSSHAIKTAVCDAAMLLAASFYPFMNTLFDNFLKDLLIRGNTKSAWWRQRAMRNGMCPSKLTIVVMGFAELYIFTSMKWTAAGDYVDVSLGFACTECTSTVHGFLKLIGEAGLKDWGILRTMPCLLVNFAFWQMFCLEMHHAQPDSGLTPFAYRSIEHIAEKPSIV